MISNNTMMFNQDKIVAELTQLRAEFKTGLADNRQFSEMKPVYLRIKELTSLLQDLHASAGEETLYF